MPQPLKIIIGDLTLTAELNDSASAQILASFLPLEFTMFRWGDEYYGNCAIDIETADDARDLMETGELALWPVGKAFCIFFRPHTRKRRYGAPRGSCRESRGQTEGRSVPTQKTG
jgi:hypothetical protein